MASESNAKAPDCGDAEMNESSNKSSRDETEEGTSRHVLWMNKKKEHALKRKQATKRTQRDGKEEKAAQELPSSGNPPPSTAGDHMVAGIFCAAPGDEAVQRTPIIYAKEHESSETPNTGVSSDEATAQPTGIASRTVSQVATTEVPRRPGAVAVQGPGGSPTSPPDAATYESQPSSDNRGGDTEILLSARVVDSGEEWREQPVLVAASPSEDLASRRDIRRIYMVGGGILLVMVAVGVTIAMVLVLGNNDDPKSSTIDQGSQGTGPGVPLTPEPSPPPSPGSTPQPSLRPTPTPQPTPSVLPSCGFTLLEGKDLFGGDFIGIPLDMAFDDAVAECKDLCTAHPSCKAFTLEGRRSICFLKDTVPSQSSKQNMSSGIKDSASSSCPTPQANYHPYPSTAIFGNDLVTPCIPLGFARKLADAYPVCQDMCSAMSECDGYNAVNPDWRPLSSVFGCCIKKHIPPGFPAAQDLGQSPGICTGVKL